jgi:large-conductance mechanosensitive channel
MRFNRTRIVDIAIASLIGGIFGTVIVWIVGPATNVEGLIVGQLDAKSITVRDTQGIVSIDGLHGIRLIKNNHTIEQMRLVDNNPPSAH